ncbi:MAG: hypothetical protein U0797_23430 [Gemmataceae bacterium]
MTEEQWLASQDAREMLAFLRYKQMSGRKYRLYACAAVRLLWQHLDDERSRHAVELAERFADGEVTRKQLADSEARIEAQRGRSGAARKTLLRSARMAATDVTFSTTRSPLPDLLRCVFRHPARPPLAPDPGWLASNGGVVRALAQGVYAERQLPQGTLDPNRLLVLSDAIEEAGCDDEEILGHLRHPGPHIRGCWVIDLLLGKQ